MSTKYRFIMNPVRGTIRRFFKSFGHELIKISGDHMPRRNGQLPGLANSFAPSHSQWAKIIPDVARMKSVMKVE
jgi:hypothetical protein